MHSPLQFLRSELLVDIFLYVRGTNTISISQYAWVFPVNNAEMKAVLKASLEKGEDV